MKQVQLFLLLFIMFFVNELSAQYTFFVSSVNKSQVKNNIIIYEGELLHSREVSIAEFDEVDYEGERQLHMVCGLQTLSFLSENKLNFDKFWNLPDEAYYPPFKQHLEIDSDIIKEGLVVEVPNVEETKSIRHKIGKGFVLIEYELNPKKMTVAFYGLELIKAKKAFIRKT